MSHPSLEPVNLLSLSYLNAKLYSQLESAAKRRGDHFSLDQLLLLDLSPAANLTGPPGIRIMYGPSLRVYA